MRESKFIEQNKAKWHSFQNNIDKKVASEKIREDFIQITDDLSYARTFYKNRSVRVYLNGLALQLYSKVYKKRNFTFNKFKNFWTTDLPRIMYLSRKQVYLAFVLFIMFMAVGWFSQAQHPEFATEFFGENYIQETEKNIKEGNPMGIYGSEGQFKTFFRITVNNLRVAFLCFVLSLIFGLGTAGFLIVNGVMLGTFWRYFYERGLSSYFNYTVWMHGGFEILSIVLAGAAGFALAQGIIHPGTFNRLRSVQLSAKRGISIMIGIVPFIIAAGFIEGYFTRFTELPNFIRGTFILSSIGFFIYYFVVYPYLKFNSSKNKELVEKEMPPIPMPVYSDRNILSNAEQFYYGMINSLNFLTKKIGLVLLFVLASSCASYFLFEDFKLSNGLLNDLSSDRWFNFVFSNLIDFGLYINGNGELLNTLNVSLFSSFIFVFSFRYLIKKFKIKIPNFIKLFLTTFIVFFMVNAILFFTEGSYLIIYYILMFISITLLLSIFYIEDGNIGNGISTGFSLIVSNFSQWIGSIIIVVFVSFLIRIVFKIPFQFMAMQWIDLLFVASDKNYTSYLAIMNYVLNMSSYAFVLIFVVYKKTWYLQSAKEILSGEQINKEIENMSLKKDIYGFKTE